MGNVCGEGVGGGCRSGIKRYETRKKVHNLNKKVRNLNKRHKTRLKGTKLDEEVQNLKEKLRKYETKHCFAFSRNNSKPFFVFSYFFQFRETIETWRSSDLFRSVSCFAKLGKNTKLSTLLETLILALSW